MCGHLAVERKVPGEVQGEGRFPGSPRMTRLVTVSRSAGGRSPGRWARAHSEPTNADGVRPKPSSHHCLRTTPSPAPVYNRRSGRSRLKGQTTRTRVPGAPEDAPCAGSAQARGHSPICSRMGVTRAVSMA